MRGSGFHSRLFGCGPWHSQSMKLAAQQLYAFSSACKILPLLPGRRSFWHQRYGCVTLRAHAPMFSPIRHLFSFFYLERRSFSMTKVGILTFSDGRPVVAQELDDLN